MRCQFLILWGTVALHYRQQRTAPSYLFEELCQPADFEARRRLRSASSSLVVRRTRLSTIGDRAFPVAAARIWNGLPPHLTSAPSLPVFRSRLKMHLFRRCFLWLHLLFFIVPVKWLVIIGHVNRSFYLLTYLLTYLLIRQTVFCVMRLSHQVCYTWLRWRRRSDSKWWLLRRCPVTLAGLAV